MSYQNKGKLLFEIKKLKYRKAISNKMLLNIFMPRKTKLKEIKNNVSEKINYQIFKNKTTL